ncbi:hypothetical protein [Micromonospora aurantiaca (nom. illeg.)]
MTLRCHDRAEQVESYCRNLLGVPADDPADAPEPAPPGPAADG